MTFVVRRRIFPVRFLQNFEASAEAMKMTENELHLLFTQINHDNIESLAYNEEGVALKQAAILEVIKLMKIQGHPVVDNKILNQRVDIRELHTVYPEHLTTFFNKKSIWKRIQDAKIDLPFMSNVTQLQLLYLILSFQQQPQIGSQYFPVRVVEYSKPLKPLMSATLSKKHQPLLVISPLGVGLANDLGAKQPRHKKLAMLIPYEQIRDMHVMLVHPPSS